MATKRAHYAERQKNATEQEMIIAENRGWFVTQAKARKATQEKLAEYSASFLFAGGFIFIRMNSFGNIWIGEIITLIFTLTGTLNRIRVKISVGNIGIFDTKRVFCANKSFKNTIYSRFLEFKSRLAHQKETDIRMDIRFLLLTKGAPSFLGIRNCKTKSLGITKREIDKSFIGRYDGRMIPCKVDWEAAA